MEITLVRHGQAQFGHNNYDQLSELGKQQALALGHHFKALEKYPEVITTGSMTRHHETASGLLKGLKKPVDQTELVGLNEYDFDDLLTAFQAQHPDKVSFDESPRRAYHQNISQALDLWMQNQLEGTSESWSQFVGRVMESFETICEQRVKNILVVSSGGPISVIVGHVLSLNNESIRRISLQIKNTSASTLLYNRVDLTLDNFNSVGHLETSDGCPAITFV